MFLGGYLTVWGWVLDQFGVTFGAKQGMSGVVLDQFGVTFGAKQGMSGVAQRSYWDMSSN